MAQRHLGLLAIALSAMLFATSATVFADQPIIPAFERLHDNAKFGEAAAGRLLLGELNCTSCHAADGALVDNKQAPVLTAVGSRVKPDYLKKFIADPHAAKPGTTMPNLFENVSADQRDEQATALTHFLASLSDSPKQELPSVGSGAAGEKLFQTVGCTVCHGSRAEGAKKLSTDKPLGDLTKKYTLPALSSFLRDPLHVRPSGRMPSMNLNGMEAKQVAAYLLELPEVANLKVSVYHGKWKNLPDFDKLTPAFTSGADKVDVKVAKKDNEFGLRYEGVLTIDTAGEYSFYQMESQ
jgi:mono/diheme cytochrome c family protein